MRILVAPDGFKGSLAASKPQQLSTAVSRWRPEAEVRLCPAADGGEGLVGEGCLHAQTARGYSPE